MGQDGVRPRGSGALEFDAEGSILVIFKQKVRVQGDQLPLQTLPEGSQVIVHLPRYGGEIVTIDWDAVTRAICGDERAGPPPDAEEE